MFNNKIIIISGGSSGLGLAMAHLLYKKDARLVLISRSQKNLEDAKKEIEGRNTEVSVCFDD